ncbi:hypothetical protein [Nocardia brasiliensis]|uniref:hypothetical protein n=1 Tax=Nocardia brasiliensis TaxID=37326 RepID=UPI003D91A3FD
MAQELYAAFGNKDSTNAQLACKDTPAKWSNPKELIPVGPDEAITGCVVMWERPSKIEGENPGRTDKPRPSEKTEPGQIPSATTAVLVVLRLSEGNTEGVTADSLEVIIDGDLVPYTDQMSGHAGAFGDFAGFGKPPGVALLATAPRDAMPAQPHSGDHSSVDALIAAGTVSGG